MSEKKEYIERGALMAKFEALKEGANLRDTLYLNGVQAAIESFPAADIEPVVHAGFVRFTDGTWHCSNCTDELPVDDDDFQPSHAEYLAKYTAYCSRCGAKLDAGASAILNGAHMERSGSGE